MQNILVKSCHFLDLKPFGDVPSPLELPILNYILGWGKVREEGLGMAGTLKEVFESFSILKSVPQLSRCSFVHTVICI